MVERPQDPLESHATRAKEKAPERVPFIIRTNVFRQDELCSVDEAREFALVLKCMDIIRVRCLHDLAEPGLSIVRELVRTNDVVEANTLLVRDIFARESILEITEDGLKGRNIRLIGTETNERP